MDDAVSLTLANPRLSIVYPEHHRAQSLPLGNEHSAGACVTLQLTELSSLNQLRMTKLQQISDLRVGWAFFSWPRVLHPTS